MSGLEIISDGTSSGTRVMFNGELVPGVIRIEIEPITWGNSIRAKLTIDMPALRVRLGDFDIACGDAVLEKKILALLQNDVSGVAMQGSGS